MKKCLIFCLLLVMVVTASAFAFAGNETSSNIDMFKEAKAINAMLQMDEIDTEYKIGEVDGTAVYNDEFALRYEKAVFSQSNTPYEDAIKSLLRTKSEYNFAIENDIMVTDKEVIAYTNAQRELYENNLDLEIREGFKKFIKLTGMTENQYWEEYKIKENTEYLTSINVSTYQDKVKIQPQAVKLSDFKLIDDNFSKENMDSYLNVQ